MGLLCQEAGSLWVDMRRWKRPPSPYQLQLSPRSVGEDGTGGEERTEKGSTLPRYEVRSAVRKQQARISNGVEVGLLQGPAQALDNPHGVRHAPREHVNARAGSWPPGMPPLPARMSTIPRFRTQLTQGAH